MTLESSDTLNNTTENIPLERSRVKHLQADLVALVVLALLTVTFFWKITLTNRVLAGLDVFAYFYPYRDFASAALREGNIPLWNPYLFMGAPLLANSQVAVLYPLHWPLLWLPAPKQVAWSIAIHIWLASAGLYLFTRRSARLSPLPSFVAAIAFGLAGFLGAQVEHLNQLNSSVWLPWLLLCLDAASGTGRRRWLGRLLGAALVGLILLAGHTQSAYIVLFSSGLYALVRSVGEIRSRKWRPVLQRLGLLALWSAAGALLALAQLLPTLELSRLSVRSGGLPYNEAASFSLKPSLILKAFFPPLLWEPPFSEYVSYIGLVGLALILVALWAAWKGRHSQAAGLAGTFACLAFAGIFLAFGAYNPVYYLLYRFFPGFDLFRAPARWLLLYGFAGAVLAGLGMQALQMHTGLTGRLSRYLQRRPFQLGLTALLVLELFAAGRHLAYNQPTAPAAYVSMRTAPSHLLADALYSDGSAAQVNPAPGAGSQSQRLFRFLSMSDIRYDPGDLGDLQAMYADTLPEESVYNLVVATKMKEVLAYNLPLLYRLFSVDGYDGGLLPINGYVTLERLFLTEEEIWPDGRLRQQLRSIPSNQLLSLLNVKYIITDKTQDAWIDDVYYDLEHTVALGLVTLEELPRFTTTHLGVVSYLEDAAGIENGTIVAEVTLTGNGPSGKSFTLPIVAGTHTAEGRYHSGPVAHRQARVGHVWRDDAAGSDYVAQLELPEAVRPGSITVRGLLPNAQFQLRGLTLIDTASGTSRSLSINPIYRLVHSGDVKIYQNHSVLPRAFLVHRARVITDDEQVLTALRDPGFDPSQTVLLASGQDMESEPGRDRVQITHYGPERVVIRVQAGEAGHLVLTDTFYPGWQATVNGQPEPIRRADLYFRAVQIPPGDHTVIFQFDPGGFKVGLTLSLGFWGLWLAATLVVTARIGRKGSSHV